MNYKMTEEIYSVFEQVLLYGDFELPCRRNMEVLSTVINRFLIETSLTDYGELHIGFDCPGGDRHYIMVNIVSHKSRFDGMHWIGHHCMINVATKVSLPTKFRYTLPIDHPIVEQFIMS